MGFGLLFIIRMTAAIRSDPLHAVVVKWWLDNAITKTRSCVTGIWTIQMALRTDCYFSAWPIIFLVFLDRIFMIFVVTESCIRCRYTDCVDVCPVDCFHEGPNFLTIDPDECIGCAICVAVCPVNAIFAEEDVPVDQLPFIKLNAELTHIWPSITKIRAPLPEADDWKDVLEKLQYLER
jgi:ferredoxin